MSGAPNLVDGFTDTLTSRYGDARELRMHTSSGRTPAAPARARLAPDLVRLADADTGAGPGTSRSSPSTRAGSRRPTSPPTGTDTGTLTGDLVALMDALGHTRFALYGTDTGMPIAHKVRRPTMSVLAIGGAESTGEGVAGTMNCAAADVQSVVRADCGHWVAEQAPEELLAAPTVFLAAYSDAGRLGVGEGAGDPSTASATVIEDTSIRPEGGPMSDTAGSADLVSGAATSSVPPGRRGLLRSIVHRLAGEQVALPVEGRLHSFEGATGWLNSDPLTPEGLRGRVVLVDFWTYTCVNWLRTLPYLRAWAAKYGTTA